MKRTIVKDVHRCCHRPVIGPTGARCPGNSVRNGVTPVVRTWVDGGMDGYDVIGDVHGYADELELLLRDLGYRERGGAWRHPSRTAVFVGDLVDRGPRQVDTVSIVRPMVDAGTARAVMGDHEYNAIVWTIADPDNSGD